MFVRIRRDGFGEEEASWYYGGTRYASPLELGATTRDIISAAEVIGSKQFPRIVSFSALMNSDTEFNWVLSNCSSQQPPLHHDLRMTTSLLKSRPYPSLFFERA